MSGDREAMSEQLSLVHESTSYDEVYLSSHEPMEDLTWPQEKEPSAHSFTEEEEEKDEEYEDEYDQEDDGEEGKDRGEGDGGVGEVKGVGQRPFILPLIWIVNDFYLTMSLKVFNTFHARYQIPDHIPMRLPWKFEKCYSGKIVDVGMYDAMFTARLRLSLTELHRQLANYLVFYVTQIALNAWRMLIGAEVIWGQLSKGNRRFTLEEFFYYYKP